MNSEFAESETGLPYGLSFGMQKAAAEAQLAPFAPWATDSYAPHVLAYVIPDEKTDSKVGIFVTFDGGTLVETAFTRSCISLDWYREYLIGLMRIAKKWVAAGMAPILENPQNDFYAYRDDRAVAVINGGKMAGSPLVSVTVSFAEKEYFARSNGGFELGAIARQDPAN
jgi:hypothetical protein